MKKIHQLILKSYVGPFVVTFFISTFILLMQFLWKWIEDFVGKGLDWFVIVKILFYASANLVPMALPLAVLLASVMTFGNMGEHYELTALKAAGISLQKIMRSVVIFTIFISIGAFFFSNNALPYTNLKMATLLFDITHKRPELNIKQGVFNNDIEGYSIKIAHKSKTSEMMYDFMIYNHTSRQGNPDVVLADSGTIRLTKDRENMIITLYNGESYVEMKDKKRRRDKEHPHRQDKFDKQTIIFELKGFDLKETDDGLFKNNYQMLNVSQLLHAIDSLDSVIVLRVDKQAINMINGSYFRFDKRVNKKDSAAVRKDSLMKLTKGEDLPIVLDFDKIKKIQGSHKRKKALKTAIAHAERAAARAASSTKDIFEKGKWKRKHQLALFSKFTLSVACLIFFLIGAPLGAIIRKGGFGMPFLVSAILFIFYYMIMMTGEKFVREGILPAYIGSWMATGALLPLGVFLTYKATTDSALLDTDAYVNAIKKFFGKIKKMPILKRFFTPEINEYTANNK